MTGAPAAPTEAAPAGAQSLSSSRPAVDPVVVGGRVKTLRTDLGLSLRDLAARSGVSAATLSQVERGESSPTLTVAARIADGLELSLSQLLRLDEGSHLAIVRSDAGRVHERAGHRVRELTPPLPGQRAEVSTHRLEAGSGTGGEADPPLHEAGGRETLVVLDGRLALEIDGCEHRLEPGDSATYDSDLEHRISNPGDAAVEFIAVVTAGPRR